MLNLNEVAKFRLVAAGSGLVLDSEKRRVVRLELNTAEPCQIKLQTGAHDIRFLCNVHGYESVSFIADGPVTVWPDSEGEVWLWSPEVETTHVVVPDAQTFTRIANRPVRNPQLELMMAKMSQNMERRMASMFGELQAENETLKAEVKKRGKRKDTSAPPTGEGASEPAGEVAEPAATGDDGGGGDVNA